MNLAPSSLTRLVLAVEYDGRPFLGWQTQKGGKTVQDALNLALSRIAGEPISTLAAGRTDTGVHAEMQVVHFDTQAVRPLSAWVRGVNSFLPDSIVVRWAAVAPPNFHARFSAQARAYRYDLLNRAVRPATQTGKVGWYYKKLDLAAMQAAANLFVGTHDFTAFRAAECQAKSPIKTVHHCQLTQQDDLIRLSISANAFLHHMVRNLVGTLVYVGAGKLAPEAVRDLITQRIRHAVPPTFMPDGLYLTGVQYAPEDNLPTWPNSLGFSAPLSNR
jgi:tRNA pseudouridine38-40 synthase